MKIWFYKGIMYFIDLSVLIASKAEFPLVSTTWLLIGIQFYVIFRNISI